jgi:hypothetical protein
MEFSLQLRSFLQGLLCMFPAAHLMNRIVVMLVFTHQYLLETNG